MLCREHALEGNPSDGGFLVAPAFTQEVLNVAMESEIVRPRARIYPMTTNSRKIPGVTITDVSGGTYFGGVVTTWEPEASTFDDNPPTFRSAELTCHKQVSTAKRRTNG